MSHREGRREVLLRRLERLQQETREIENELGKGASEYRESALPPEAETTVASLISEHSSDLVSVHTIQGHYIYASPSASSFLGHSPDALVGRSVYDFYHHADVEQIAAVHAKHLDPREGDLAVRYRLESDKGKLRWVESHARVTPNGELLVAITRAIEEPRDDTSSGDDGSERQAMTPEADHLTKLPNRLVLEGELARELDRSRRYGHHLSVALFDVDRFTSIGDLSGHEATRILRNVSFLLRKNQRIYDTLGRWGRDEFLLLLPQTPLEGAHLAAERYRRAVERAGLVSRGTPVTVSAGLASSDSINSIDDLIAHVDEALHAAKESGRNRIARFH